MLAGCPQKDGRLLGFDCADQISHRTEPWDMVSETKEVMQMKSKKGYINKHMVFLGTKFLSPCQTTQFSDREERQCLG